MMSSLIFVFLLAHVAHVRGIQNGEIRFDQNYEISWGGSHAVSLNQGTEMQLTMDNSSGSGFVSKVTYGSGFFHMRIKVPGGDSAGVVTTFYLTSDGKAHDELDFEFMGVGERERHTLQTNVFANGEGNREQRIYLWFDPSENFHDYKILLNQHQIVFFVDDVPIRVYKNKSNIGVGYPSKPMKIKASLWDGDSWATHGGRVKTNWSYAPFKANYQGFDVQGCQVQSLNDQHCVSTNFWWNSQSYWQLNPSQQTQNENVKQKFLFYDYCTDMKRYPTPPKECVS